MRKRGLFLRRATGKFSGFCSLCRRSFSSALAPRRAPFEPTKSAGNAAHPQQRPQRWQTFALSNVQRGCHKATRTTCCSCVAPSTFTSGRDIHKARSYNICSAQPPTCAADVTNVAPHAHRSITRRGWRRENRYPQQRRPRARRGRGPRLHVSSGDAHRPGGRSFGGAGASRAARTT